LDFTENSVEEVQMGIERLARVVARHAFWYKQARVQADTKP